MMKIFIVEDDENIRGIVKYALEGAGFTVKDFESSKELWLRLEQESPDLFILDIMLPEEDGISILKKIKSNKDIPVILLSAKDSEFDKVKGLDLGADDYITKPFSVLELISRVKVALRGRNQYTKDNILEAGNVTLSPEKHQVRVGEREVELTYKEFKLLEFLMENKGNVLSREKIMNFVWGTDFQGESRTVDVHIKTLRTKLDLKEDFIKTIRGAGYKIND